MKCETALFGFVSAFILIDIHITSVMVSVNYDDDFYDRKKPHSYSHPKDCVYSNSNICSISAPLAPLPSMASSLHTTLFPLTVLAPG